MIDYIIKKEPQLKFGWDSYNNVYNKSLIKLWHERWGPTQGTNSVWIRSKSLTYARLSSGWRPCLLSGKLYDERSNRYPDQLFQDKWLKGISNLIQLWLDRYPLALILEKLFRISNNKFSSGHDGA